MQIDINDNTALREIQVVFSNFYPYLEINFYKKGHKKYEPSDERDLVEPITTVGNIKKNHVSGLLEILPSYKAADVEREFQERFGLSVQILRKEKDAWVQTTGMDEFTLKELNEFGRSSFDEYILSDEEKELSEKKETPPRLY